MAADRFDLETFDGQDEPIGLSFYKQMFAGGQATEFPPARTERGTTLRLFVRDADTYTTLLERFPHWCRGVQGLKASEVPRGPLKQGDLGVRQVGAVAVKLPTGIERATLRPVGAKTAWDAMTGSSRVTILYRGVFVQDYVAKGLWGMEGSVHVDPKHFRPRLNREGFVGDSFKLEIDSFLRGSHPIVLASLAQSLGNASAEGKLDEWSTRRWATLWLSVPRDAAYSHAASQWDAVFRRIPAFELAEGSKWIAATVDDLVKINGTIFVAPHPNEGQNDLIKSATRLLRETGRPVMRGLAREPGWLREAGAYFATTADLVTSQFKDELPKLQMIAPNAEAILDDLRVSYVLYTGEHPVELVALGEEAPPVLRVGQRLLVNTDVQLGRLFVLRCVELNRGRRGLIEIAADIMPQQLTSVVAVVKAEATDDDETFGLVKRRYVRSLIS
jgi:hypothetical protein